MKYFFIIFFLAPFVTLAQIPSAKSFLKAWGIEGEVKQLTQWFYGDENAFQQKKPSIKTIIHFNIAGRAIEETKIEDKKISETVYKYSGHRVYDTTRSNGKIIKTEMEVLDGSGRMVEQDVDIRDVDAPPTIRKVYFKDIFKYDKNGNQTESDDYDEKNKLMMKFFFIYNSDNQVIEEKVIEYRPGRQIQMTTVNSYDAKGLRVRYNNYEAEKLTHQGLISYNNLDKRGNWLLSIENGKFYSDIIYKNESLKSITAREIIYFQ